MARWLEAMTGGRVLLKCENLQRTGSFKIRGAYVRLSRLSEGERAAGVVAASAGNHAQGVALAAQMLGIRATVFASDEGALTSAVSRICCRNASAIACADGYLLSRILSMSS